jgi:PAS domain S-box-containing protein
LKDEVKAKEQLINELKSLRQQIAELKSSEQKKTEEAYRALVENSLQGLAILQNYMVVFVNPAIAAMLGYTEEELISFSPEELNRVVHPEDRSFVWKRYQDRLEGKPVPSRYEFRMMRKDGKVIWMEMFSTRIKYNGKPAIQAAFVDITEHKRAEEKLRSVEKEKVTILNSMTEHVVYQDKELKIIWANKATGESVGLAPEELIGRYCYEIWQKRSQPCVNCPVAEAIRTGEPHETEMTTTDGRVWFVRGHPVRDTNGNIEGAVVITLEITERKNAEERLRENEEKFRNLAEQSPNMIFINKQGRVVYANKKCEEIMGYKREEFYSSDFDFLKLISPEYKDLGGASFSRHMKGEEITPLEFTLITKGGAKIEAILTSKLIKYEGDQAILGTVTDITERKKMQEELLKAKKLESIGILAGGIAHDFNNILTGILGNISLAKTKADSDNEIFKILAKAEKASLRAKDLTQQLLTFSKGGAPIKEATSIAELIEDSAEFALRGFKIRCEFSMPQDLWPVEIDKGQINQVVNNLIINADQAMPEGGIIKVSAENATIRKQDVLPLQPGKYVKITLKDHGIGIPKQHLQRIFDPYFTTKHKGDGLGLATSYSIIKNHKGHIHVESELGFGSTFIIYLPASPKKVPKKKVAEEKPLAGKGKILVMDDEEVVRDVIGDLLAILGYEVEFAEDGSKVIELYKKAEESKAPYDAVIMDLTVPGGMGGKESIQELIQIDPEVKAIVSSGYSNDPVMANFRKHGFSGVVAKPFKIEELSKVLHQAITERSKTPV